MNFKDEKGVTGVDVAIAIIVMFIFVSIIAVLFYNYKSASEELEKKSKATYYAIDEIENIKSKGITPFLDVNVDATINSMNGYVKENNIETPYYKTVTSVDYIDTLERGQDNNKIRDLVKKVTVTITYKHKNKEEKVEISTVLSKES